MVQAPNHLTVWPTRFTFLTETRTVFPAGKASNTLRGALGLAFRASFCDPTCASAKTCPQAGTCPYTRIFEPCPAPTGPSGLGEAPRPFALRAAHLDGRTVLPGQTFYLDVVLFENSIQILNWWLQALQAMAQAGIGPTRGSARLLSAQSTPSQELFWQQGSWLTDTLPHGLTLSATDSANPVPTGESTLTIRFLTPTELKVGERLSPQPDFGVLIRRLRDRVSNLRAAYQGGPLEINFAAWGRAADQVHITRGDLQPVQVERRSSKTGQRHSLGGFIGEVEYTGDFAAFIPVLSLGQWTGVGRQTVWGKGQFLVQKTAGPCSGR